MNERWEEFSDTTDGPVRGYLHRPDGGAGDGLVLTHGAGANARSPLLIAVAEAFCAAGLIVLRCDLPFRQERPQGPPRGSAERDQAGLRAAVTALRRVGAGRIFLGGHSYGGRQATMLAARERDVAEALLLLSYPLHPPRKPEELRTAHFPMLETAALFVSGTRDPFGSVAELEAALALIRGRTELLSVESAGHELLTRGNRESLPGTIVDAFLRFAHA